MYLEGSVKFGENDWMVCTSETPRDTLHVLYKELGHVFAFGAKDDLPEKEISDLIQNIETILSENQFEDEGYKLFYRKVSKFDGLAFFSGPKRRFLKGWSEQDKNVVHIFPFFKCEINGSESPNEVVEFIVNADALKLSRNPCPAFEFKMHGEPSQLEVREWSKCKYSTLLSFINVLSEDSKAEIQVKNINGNILEFNTSSGWQEVDSKVHNHLCLQN